MQQADTSATKWCDVEETEGTVFCAGEVAEGVNDHKCLVHSRDPRKDMASLLIQLNAQIASGKPLECQYWVFTEWPLATGGLLSGMKLLGGDFTGATFTHEVKFSGAQFEGPMIFRNAKFEGHALFHGTHFQNVSFANATFRAGADFRQAGFGISDFEFASFSKSYDTRRTTDFAVAVFEHSPAFRKTRFLDETSFVGAEFHENTTFNECEFADTNLQAVDMSKLVFVKCDMENVCLEGALKLEDARFDQVTWPALRRRRPLPKSREVVEAGFFVADEKKAIRAVHRHLQPRGGIWSPRLLDRLSLAELELLNKIPEMYHKLQEVSKKARDWEQQSQFVVREMEARRSLIRARRKLRRYLSVIWWWLALYGLVRYGESLRRGVLLIALLLLLFPGVMYLTQPGAAGAERETYLSLLVNSVKNVLSSKPLEGGLIFIERAIVLGSLRLVVPIRWRDKVSGWLPGGKKGGE